MPSRVSGFRRVICLVHCIHLCIMCIASCHHAIMSLIFATHINKPYGSLVHLNRGNSHGVSLYNISSQYLGSYIKPFHWIGITHKRTWNLIPCLFYLISWSPTLSIIISPFTEAPPKFSIFWTYRIPTSFSLIWIKFKWGWIQLHAHEPTCMLNPLAFSSSSFDSLSPFAPRPPRPT